MRTADAIYARRRLLKVSDGPTAEDLFARVGRLATSHQSWHNDALPVERKRRRSMLPAAMIALGLVLLGVAVALYKVVCTAPVASRPEEDRDSESPGR
jgi:hypothetical protein